MEKREISAVQIPCDPSGNPADYRVGAHGVTKITETGRNGEYCYIPYVEVWMGDDVVLEACMHKCSFVEYFIPNRPAHAPGKESVK